MTYRLARKEDVEQINALASKNELQNPNLQLCFVAENEGRIVGFVNMALEPVIDTLVSENPLSVQRLMDMMMGACSAHKRVICQTNRDSVGKQAEKYGFESLGSMNVLIKEM